MKIGIIRERKVPVDKRVPLTPNQAKELMQIYPQVKIVVEASDIRCYKDQEYEDLDVEVVEEVSDCDVLMGVKEVPIDALVPDKTYFFFSHTIKQQPYNRELLRSILKKNITLIDYEALTDQEGMRLVAFGRYAGIVGAYNGIRTYGKRYNLFDLRRANECFDLEDMKREYEKVKFPAIKIVLTGGGRVARGAMEVLDGIGIRKVTPAAFVKEQFNVPVYTQLNTRDYNKPKSGEPFKRSEFYSNPGLYENDFLQYAHEADLLIAGAYWAPAAPVLFTREDILGPDFRIKVVADITCDIEGSIPSTKKPSTIDDPNYDYNPSDDKIEPTFKEEGNITVMAVDNLPCELPRNASEDFGRELIDKVLANLIKEDKDSIIERATVTKGGQLTQHFSYLKDYVGRI